MAVRGPILVVDDDPVMRQMLASHLEEIGAPFALAGGVAEAISLLSGSRFSVVVSDVQMRPLDGFALLDALNGEPPVLLMSSFSPPSLENEAISKGAAAFLRKPFTPDDLFPLLERIENGLRCGGVRQ